MISRSRNLMMKEESPYRRKHEQIYEENIPEINFSDYERHIEAANKFAHALNSLEEHFRPDSVLCRDEEKQRIEDYLERSLESSGSSETLYISGVPGIGKTLCVKEVASYFCQRRTDECDLVYVNALTIKCAYDIFKAIFYELFRKIEESKSAMYKLNEYFEKGTEVGSNEKLRLRKKKKVLIIDEIDYLRTRDEEVLYNIFEWTQKKKSNLIVIAISNTMDFPETLTPKLTSRMGNQRLMFKPYSSSQLDSILKQRVGHLNVFADQAIIYICKKIAQCSSDVRKCLFILRESINEFMLLEQIRRDDKEDRRRRDIRDKRIDVDLLAKVHDSTYRDTFVSTFIDFPAAYKIVLYCLAKYFRSETRACTMRQLQNLCGDFLKEKSQLRPILNDLRDMGVIKINFMYNKFDARINQEFQNMKQLKEENIKLLIEYDKIIYALQRENLTEIKFRIDLNF